MVDPDGYPGCGVDVVGTWRALAQTSVRRLLAYSAIAHGATCCWRWRIRRSPRSNEAVLYYILTYGLTTVGAFGGGGSGGASDGQTSWMRSSDAEAQSAAGFGNAGAVLGWRAFRRWWVFAAEFNLFAAVCGPRGSGAWGLVALAIGMSAVSVYYYLQVLKRAYVMPERTEASSIEVPSVTAVVLASWRRGASARLFPVGAARLDFGDVGAVPNKR